MTTQPDLPAPDDYVVKLDKAFASLRAGIAQLTEASHLRSSDTVQLVRLCRKLAGDIPNSLAEIADGTVYAMTRTATYPVVAEQLGVSLKAVEKAVRQHRARNA